MVTRRLQDQLDNDDDDDIPETEGLIRSKNTDKGNSSRRPTRHNKSGDTADIHPRENGSNGRPRIPSSDSTEIAALNLDHLTNRKVQVVSTVLYPKSPSSSSPSRKSKKFYKTYYGRTVSISEYCRSHISMLCYYYPYTCGCMVLVVLIVVMTVLASLMLNPVQKYGIIEHDHSNIKSIYDFQLGKIDHWCLGGGNDDCNCDDPTMPRHRSEYISWIEAFKSNRKLVKRFSEKVEGSNLDIAFVGESIIEEIDGRWMGVRNRSEGLRNLEGIFNQHFRKKQGNATYEGVALGIAGDTSPNVLYRLLHGEMPAYFQPKVWWLSLGNNDLGRTGCSEEVVVIGILRVVEEIFNRQANAHVVINSLFPMTTTRGGLYPVISDYEDSFIRLGHDRSLLRKSKRTKQPKLPMTQVPLVINDTDMSAVAAKEEGKRDQDAKKERRYTHRPPSQPNPIMLDDVTKTHKYKIGAPVFSQTDKPLWTSIRAINKELKKFASKNTDRVTFFDATELFATKLSSNKYQLLTDRISDRGHPTEEGFRIWEDDIVRQLDQILNKMKKEYPELFKPIAVWNGGGDTTKGEKRTDATNTVANDDFTSQEVDDFEFEKNDDFIHHDEKNKDGTEKGGNILVDPDGDDDDDGDASEEDLIISSSSQTTPQPKTDDTDD